MLTLGTTTTITEFLTLFAAIRESGVAQCKLWTRTAGACVSRGQTAQEEPNSILDLAPASAILGHDATGSRSSTRSCAGVRT